MNHPHFKSLGQITFANNEKKGRCAKGKCVQEISKYPKKRHCPQDLDNKMHCPSLNHDPVFILDPNTVYAIKDGLISH